MKEHSIAPCRECFTNTCPTSLGIDSLVRFALAGSRMPRYFFAKVT